MITPPKPDPAALRHRILVVDDEEIVLVALGETLRRERYEVFTTLNPVEALETLKREPFSVIITDHQMPQLTGLELFSQAKQIQPDATRILITAVLNLDTVIDAINKGEIFRFIVKPWLREELLVTVKNAVQRFEMVRRNAELQATTLAMNEQLIQLNRSLEQQVVLIAKQNTRLAELNQALEQDFQRSVELCLHTMQTFYPSLGSQARRAFAICKGMGEALGLSPEERRTLETSAWLHDIGLVGVPRHLIKRWQERASSLNEAERALIEHHAVLGQELASFANQWGNVGETIRAHHERYDGQGYPDQLAGDNIPWLGRLLAVAVAYASCPYAAADAIEYVKTGVGTAFDPGAVQALMRALPRASVPRKEREVLLSELRPGMVLAQGIYTASGLLLMPEGQRLSDTYIEKLFNHNRIHPITQSLVVYC